MFLLQVLCSQGMGNFEREAFQSGSVRGDCNGHGHDHVVPRTPLVRFPWSDFSQWTPLVLCLWFLSVLRLGKEPWLQTLFSSYQGSTLMSWLVPTEALPSGSSPRSLLGFPHVLIFFFQICIFNTRCTLSMNMHYFSHILSDDFSNHKGYPPYVKIEWGNAEADKILCEFS